MSCVSTVKNFQGETDKCFVKLGTLKRKMTGEVTSPKEDDCFCKTLNWVTKHNHQVLSVLYWILTHQGVSPHTFNTSCNACFFPKEHPSQPLAHLVRVGGLAAKKRFHSVAQFFLLPIVSVIGSSAQSLELTPIFIFFLTDVYVTVISMLEYVSH